MLDTFAINQRTKKIEDTLSIAGASLQIDKNRAELVEMEKDINSDDFWNDSQKAQKISSDFNKKKSKIAKHEQFIERLEDILIYQELVVMEESEQEEEKFIDDLVAFENEIEKYKLETLFDGKFDDLNAIVTLHAGAGGTEAQDWNGMLYRMYGRYLERNKFKIKILELLDGDEAGIKSVTFLASGENAYGFLKCEKGVHRLVRISPFDSNKRRHTSFASIDVMPELLDSHEVVIKMEEVKIDTYRSGGAGGQHVNTTDSAVRMTHMPTGLVVQCQNERSQIQNRETALSMLKSKLAEQQEQERLAQAQGIQGDLKKIEWGSQIRSYVFCPYTMVKDHRTGYETGNVSAVMDGYIDNFIGEYLKKSHK